MLKGKATIQLRNAKTGKLEQEVTEENIVTKATENMMNIPKEFEIAYAADHRRNWASYFFDKSNMPNVKFLFGGLVLFNEKNEESENTFFPTPGNKVIGLAGQKQEDTVDMRVGECNTTESTEIENGYRFVWDFDTERANGKISSISLTNRYAGQYWYGSWVSENPRDYAYPAMITPIMGSNTSPSNFTYNFVGTNAFSVIQEKLEGDDRRALVLYISPENDDGSFWSLVFSFYTGKMWKFTFANPLKITLMQKNLIRYISHDLVFTVDGLQADVSSTDTHPCSWIDPQKKINIMWNFSQTGNIYNTKHAVYTFEGNKESITEVKLPRSNNSSYGLFPNYGYIGNGKYCYMYVSGSSGEIRIISSDGELISTVKEQSSNPTYWVEGGGQGFAVSKTGDCYYFLNCKSAYNYDTRFIAKKFTEDGMSLTRTVCENYTCIDNGDSRGSQASCPVYVDREGEGYETMLLICFAGYRNNEPSTTIGGGKVEDYLATVNNLETPITKTDAQTMKIIYELVEVEE